MIMTAYAPIDYNRLDNALAHAVQHPEHHAQESYGVNIPAYLAANPGSTVERATDGYGTRGSDATLCGTACCIAGRAALQAGARFKFREGLALRCITTGGLNVDIESYAARLLGLSDYQATALFAGGNTLNDLINYRNEFASMDGGPVTDYDTLKNRVLPFD